MICAVVDVDHTSTDDMALKIFTATCAGITMTVDLHATNRTTVTMKNGSRVELSGLIDGGGRYPILNVGEVYDPHAVYQEDILGIMDQKGIHPIAPTGLSATAPEHAQRHNSGAHGSGVCAGRYHRYQLKDGEWRTRCD